MWNPTAHVCVDVQSLCEAPVHAVQDVALPSLIDASLEKSKHAAKHTKQRRGAGREYVCLSESVQTMLVAHVVGVSHLEDKPLRH